MRRLALVVVGVVLTAWGCAQLLGIEEAELRQDAGGTGSGGAPGSGGAITAGSGGATVASSGGAAAGGGRQGSGGSVGTGGGGAVGTGGAGAGSGGRSGATGGAPSGSGGRPGTGGQSGGGGRPPGTGGAATGGTATGGAGTGGAGTGGSPPACPPPYAAVISDFTESGIAQVNQRENRNGLWFVGVESGSLGTIDPAGTPEGFLTDTAMGPCTATSFRVKATGITGWGVAIGTNLSTEPVAPYRHRPVDASGYSGVRAWMKCARATSRVTFAVLDVNTDPNAVGSTCTDPRGCSGHGVWDETVGTAWRPVEIVFATAVQHPFGTGPAVPRATPSKLTMIQVAIEAIYEGTPPTPRPNDFECWIDDVHFF
jgi:hypothetical protein